MRINEGSSEWAIFYALIPCVMITSSVLLLDESFFNHTYFISIADSLRFIPLFDTLLENSSFPMASVFYFVISAVCFFIYAIFLYKKVDLSGIANHKSTCFLLCCSILILVYLVFSFESSQSDFDTRSIRFQKHALKSKVTFFLHHSFFVILGFYFMGALTLLNFKSCRK